MQQENIWYAGCEMIHTHTYDEKKDRHWQDDAQDLIEINRSRGRAACVKHEGNLHHFFVEKKQ